MRGNLFTIGALVGLTSTASADLLQNDGFTDGQLVAFHGGFVSGEIGAARFTGPAGRQLLRVNLLFGQPVATGASQAITLKVWDDPAGNAPGVELFSNDYTLIDSNNTMQAIDVAAVANVITTTQFRVGILLQHDGPPSIANDSDGLQAPAKNYLFAIPGGWIRSSTAGVGGDWIIRAEISNAPGVPDASPATPDANAAVPDAAAGTPDAGGGACLANSECPVGEYCDPTAHVCTFDCREDMDCSGSDTCSSLGQCVEGDGGGGCCRTSDGGRGTAGSLLFGLGVLTLLVRRRR